MTRTERNKRNYRRTNLFVTIVILLLKGIFKLIKIIIKLIFWLLIHLIILIYKLIRLIDTLIGKGFMKLPRLLKVGVIYTMLILSIITIVNFTNDNKTTNVKAIEKNVVNTIVNQKKDTQQEETTTQENVEETATQTSIDLGNENANNIYNKAIELGLTQEQSLMVVSISKHETGNWTSKVFLTKNNFGGVMCNKGLRSYNTYEDGLTHFVTLLKNNYFDLGLTTVEQIGKKYCPIGASNDPKGLNKNWVPSVTNIYNSYLASVK